MRVMCILCTEMYVWNVYGVNVSVCVNLYKCRGNVSVCVCVVCMCTSGVSVHVSQCKCMGCVCLLGCQVGC